MSRKDMIMVGGSGMAGGWIKRLTESHGDRVRIVALVDVLPEVLEKQGTALGLAGDRLFTDTRSAIDSVKADFVGVCTPPQFHREGVVAALDAGMPVITEKPIADTLESAKAMLEAAERTGLPCAVIQNYRYNATMLTVREVLRSGRVAPLQQHARERGQLVGEARPLVVAE